MLLVPVNQRHLLYVVFIVQRLQHVAGFFGQRLVVCDQRLKNAIPDESAELLAVLRVGITSTIITKCSWALGAACRVRRQRELTC